MLGRTQCHQNPESVSGCGQNTQVPVTISFLANLIGLGGIAKTVQEIIKQIRKPIDKVVGKVVGFVVGKVKQFIGKLMGTTREEEPESTEKTERVNRGHPEGWTPADKYKTSKRR